MKWFTSKVTALVAAVMLWGGASEALVILPPPPGPTIEQVELVPGGPVLFGSGDVGVAGPGLLLTGAIGPFQLLATATPTPGSPPGFDNGLLFLDLPAPLGPPIPALQGIMIDHSTDLPPSAQFLFAVTLDATGLGFGPFALLTVTPAISASGSGPAVSSLPLTAPVNLTLAAVQPIPLPAAGWLMVAGIGGLVALRRRRRV